MNASESQQNLLNNEARATSVQSLSAPADYILGPVEKHFLLSAERGDCATVRRLLEENAGHPEILNIDCVDPLNRSALISAVENENADLIILLLELGISVKVGVQGCIGLAERGERERERRAVAPLRVNPFKRAIIALDSGSECGSSYAIICIRDIDGGGGKLLYFCAP